MWLLISHVATRCLQRFVETFLESTFSLLPFATCDSRGCPSRTKKCVKMCSSFCMNPFKTLSFNQKPLRCLWTTPLSGLQCLVLEGCWKLSAPACPKKLVVIAAAWGLQCQWLSKFRAAAAAKAHAPNRDRSEQPERLRMPFQLWWRKRRNGQRERRKGDGFRFVCSGN